MMGPAKVQISYQVDGQTDGGGPTQTVTCVVEMVFNYLSSSTWSESIGRLGYKRGDWTVSTDKSRATVYFHDEKGNPVAKLEGVPIKSSFGYPLTGMKGKSGTGLFLNGMSGMKGFDWQFLDA